METANITAIVVSYITSAVVNMWANLHTNNAVLHLAISYIVKIYIVKISVQVADK